jgi:hypothetical protein
MRSKPIHCLYSCDHVYTCIAVVYVHVIMFIHALPLFILMTCCH